MAGEALEILNRTQILERGWGIGRFALRNVAHLGNLASVLVAWQVSAGTGLGALATLEVECLHFLQQLFFVAKLGAGQLIEVTGVFLLLLRQHSAFAGTDTGTRELGPPGQGNLRLLRQGPEAHVGNE